jgi:hypothetical protein
MRISSFGPSRAVTASLAMLLATGGCGDGLTAQEELAKERARHTADVQQLAKELAAADAWRIERMTSDVSGISKIQFLEETQRVHERLLRTVPVRHWLDLLREEDPGVQDLVASYLGGQRARANEVVVALLDALDAGEVPPDIALEAVVELASAAVEPLVGQLGAKSETRQINALRHLGAIGQEAKPALPRIGELISTASSGRVVAAAKEARRRIAGDGG